MLALELQGLTKRFRAETVLDGLSFGVAEGETLAIFGPSGAGKTVLLRLIAGVEDPTAGRVLMAGRDVTDVPPEGRGVGMAFQNFALFPHMTAFDNIAAPLAARRDAPAVLKAGVEKVARLLKIDHVLGQAPRALSNGQKQRTALARALAAEPKLLLLDDPLRNVDAKLRFEMRLELPRLLSARGATVLYVTQDYREAMALGDRIAVLGGGGIVQIGTPADIYHHPATVEVARLFGDPVINLVTVEADGQGRANLAGVSVPLPPGTPPGPVTLGLRPEALSPGGPVAARVAAVTPLNEKTVTLLEVAGGLQLLLSRPGHEAAPAPGDTLGIGFDPAALHVFGPDGRRIGGRA